MGLIKELGISINTPEELVKNLSDQQITFIQMPFNILDWRWDEYFDDIEYQKKNRKLFIHARSVLLQGLLTSKDKNLWEKANVSNSKSVFIWLHDLKLRYKCASEIELCIKYVLSNSIIDGIVMGVENLKQLRDNLKFFNNSTFDFEIINEIRKKRPKLTELSLSPQNWNLN